MTFICRTAVPSACPGLVPARSRLLPGCLCDTAAVAIGNGVLPARPRGAGDSEEARFRRQARRAWRELGPAGLGAAWGGGLSACGAHGAALMGAAASICFSGGASRRAAGGLAACAGGRGDGQGTRDSRGHMRQIHIRCDIT